MISLRQSVGENWNGLAHEKFYTDKEILKIRALYEKGAPFAVISARLCRSASTLGSLVSKEIKAGRMQKIPLTERRRRWAAQGA